LATDLESLALEDSKKDCAMDANKVAIYGGRYFASSEGHIYNASGKRLSAGKSSSGYLCVSLSDGSRPKKPKSFLVHRLVAQAFLGESPLTVNHIDGNKLNNQLSNLEYLSVADNNRHAVNVLGHHIGEKNHKCKLTYQQVIEIRSSKLSGVSVAKEFGVSVDYVYRIRRNEARNVVEAAS
jgi:hypothetical protein